MTKILCHSCGIDHQILEYTEHVCIDCDGHKKHKLPELSLYQMIKFIVNMEKDFESKQHLLTEIGLASENRKTFDACELYRNELVRTEDSSKRETRVLHKNRSKKKDSKKSELEKESSEPASISPVGDRPDSQSDGVV